MLSQTDCESSDWVVAIDGGGSKVAGALARLSNNPASGDFTATVRHSMPGTGSAAPLHWGEAAGNIVAVITELLRVANIGADQVRHIVLMLAGAGRPDDVARVRQSLSAVATISACRYLTITSDMRPLLIYAKDLLPKLPTIVLISGTGSIVASLGDDDETVRAGGWGPILGDEGSGWRIAWQVLKLLCNWIDSGSPALVANPAKNDGLMDLLEIVKVFSIQHRLLREDSPMNSAILALANDRHLAAQLAPAILDAAARSTQSLAYQVVLEELSGLVDQVEQVHQRINASPNSWRLALAGGLASNQSAFQDLLNKQLHQRGLHPQSLVTLDPVLAALHFAAVTGVNPA